MYGEENLKPRSYLPAWRTVSVQSAHKKKTDHKLGNDALLNVVNLPKH